MLGNKTVALPPVDVRRQAPYWTLRREEFQLRIETSRALANHIRRYRGDPSLRASEEEFLASVEAWLRRYNFTVECSERQLAIVWEIIDRIEAAPAEPDLVD